MPVRTSARNPHMAEECADDWCPRLPCRLFREGYRRGYDRGYADGYAAGFTAGYAQGHSEGYAAGAASCSCGGR